MIFSVVVEECARLEMMDLAVQTLLPYMTSQSELLKLMTEHKEKTFKSSLTATGEEMSFVKKEIKVEPRYSTSPAL